MGLLNRVKNKSIEKAKDNFTDSAIADVYPIYLKNKIGLGNQKAIQDIDKSELEDEEAAKDAVKAGYFNTDPKHIQDVIEKALEAVKENIEDGLLDFLSPFVHIYHFGLEGYECTAQTSLKDLLYNIPVYLVLDGYDKQIKVTSDEKIIPNGIVTSYDMPWKKSEEKPLEEMLPKKVNVNALGMYVHDENPSMISRYADIWEHRRIFLWIDRIYHNSEKNGIDYMTNIMSVLYHELGHALMDVLKIVDSINPSSLVFYDGKIKANHYGIMAKFLYKLREESLANGISLYSLLNSKGVNLEDYFKIRESDEKSSMPYSLGISYIDKQCLEVSVPIWMNIKVDNYSFDICNYMFGKFAASNLVNASNIDKWFTAVRNNGPFIPWSKLKQVEYNLHR